MLVPYVSTTYLSVFEVCMSHVRFFYENRLFMEYGEARSML